MALGTPGTKDGMNFVKKFVFLLPKLLFIPNFVLAFLSSTYLLFSLQLPNLRVLVSELVVFLKNDAYSHQ